MSRSWSCLKVESFLGLCNWEGKLPAQPLQPQPLQPQDIPTSLPCLTVDQFLRLCNWERQLLESSPQTPNQLLDLPLPNSAVAQANYGQVTWRRISVKEFFSKCNWQGVPLVENKHWQHLDPYFRLKQPVREFFQYVPWEGEPEIGKLQKHATLSVSGVEPEPTFTDLSDLF